MTRRAIALRLTLGLAMLIGIIGITATPPPVSAGPSLVAATASSAGCAVSESTNGGLISCPRSRPLPDFFTALLPHTTHISSPRPSGQRDGNVEPMATDGFADYYCDYGVTCFAYDVMGQGIANHWWEGYHSTTGTLEEVEYFQGQCTDPSGCQELSWWTPPDNNWRGDNIYVDSDNFIEIVQCWCGDANSSKNCTIH